ncbi:MAG: hypothetical protein ABIQ89_03130 [Candidatus Saccharimonadales bacterium]
MVASQKTTQMILKDILARLIALDEALAKVPSDIRNIKEDLNQLKAEVTVMRAVVTDHSYELKAYGERLRDLELGY